MKLISQYQKWNGKKCTYFRRLIRIVPSIAGVWALFDEFFGTDLNAGVLSFTIGMVVLILTRCVRNSISPPVVAASDLNEEFFTIKTRFRVPVTTETQSF